MKDRHEVDTVEFELPAATVAANGQSRPPSALVEVDLSGLSHQGKVRTNNEDHFLVVRFGRFLEALCTNLPDGDLARQSQEIGYAMTVADGIGGGAAGEVASKLAINSLVHLALDTPDWVLLLDDALFQTVQDRMTERFRAVNATLLEKARANRKLRGFGTTLTVALTLGRDMLITHVGDSRAYRFRQGKLTKLTADHTLVQSMADDGLLAQEEVATHRLRHVLSRAIGADDPEVKPDVRKLTLENNDCLLLCTDGLTDMVREDQIAEILGRGETAARCCQRLVDAALNAGGRDNVTVIVAYYRLP
jgi:PPM family protein phosphatase